MFEAANVDPAQFCRQSAEWGITSDLAAFPRLAQEFAAGRLACRVTGRVDRDNAPVLHVEVNGEVLTTCQRCLNDLVLALAIERDIRLASSAAELERYEADADFGGDVIPMPARLSLIELIEDEVLLGLAFSPMHAPGECALPANLT
jgi:uncharacterized protein